MSSALSAELSTLRALFLRAVRAGFAYKPALFMSLASSALSAAIPILVWRHIYLAADQPHVIPARSLFPYLLLAGCLNFAFILNVEDRIAPRIRLGLIATDLLRPVDFQMSQLAQALSDAVFNGVLMLPVFAVVVAFLGRAALPRDALALLAFGVSVALAFVILFAVSFVFVLATFVTYSGYGVFVARKGLQQTFSGLWAPLALFPPGLRTVSEWLPFRHSIHTPLSIYLGWTRGTAVLHALGAQPLWALGLIALGRFLFGRCLRRFDIQGG